MRISVITVTYNSAETIRDTLASILGQDYANYELIIKDGGSKDGTLNICKEFEPRFMGKMHILSCPDSGIYDAMNQGLRAATGEVVGLLNSDDFYSTPDILSSIAKEFEEDGNLDAVYGDVQYVSWNNTHKKGRYYSSAGFQPWKMRIGLMPAHPTFYCRKKIYEHYGFFDTSYNVASDFECLLRFIYINHINTKYIPKQMVTMRSGGTSNANLESRKQIMREHLRALRNHHLYANIILLSLRYFGKIWDLVKAKIKNYSL